MKLRHLALLSALVPAAALVNGCGGGSGGPATPTPVPAPTFIGPSTGTPNFPTIAVPETRLLLPGGELGLLNLSQTGGSAAGNLRVLSGVTSSSSLATGVYPLSGVISNATAFSVSNPGVGADNFSLAGNVTAPNGGGNITLTRGNSPAPAKILINGGRVPASTPYSASGDLTFSNIRSTDPNNSSPPANIDFVPVTRSGEGAFTPQPTFLGNVATGGDFDYFTDAANSVTAAVRVTGVRVNPNNRRQDVSFQIGLGGSNALARSQFRPGASFDVTAFNTIVVARFGLSDAVYFARTGSVLVRDLSAGSVSLELRDVVFQSFGSVTDRTVTVNGKFDASGLESTLNVN